jgi:arylformamidase
MKNLVFAAVATGLFATSAVAQGQNGARLSEACRTEIKTLCGASTDRDARRTCMKENRSKISEGCRAEMKARRAARMDGHNGHGTHQDPTAK